MPTKPGMTAEQALRAIEARIQGKFDDPELKAFGPLSTDSNKDILDIIEAAKAPASPASSASTAPVEDLEFWRGIAKHFGESAKTSGSNQMRIASDSIRTLTNIIEQLQTGKTQTIDLKAADIKAVDPKAAEDVANYLENEIQNHRESYGNTDEALGRWNRAVATLYQLGEEGPQSLSNIDPVTARDVADYLDNEIENNKDLTPETLGDWRGVVNALRELGESAPVLPEIVVVMDGGLVQAVMSSDPAAIGQTVRIIDYDMEGADPESLVEIPLLDEPGKVVDAVSWTELVTVSDLDLANIREVEPEKDPQP